MGIANMSEANTNREQKAEAQISPSELYGTLTSLVMHAEQLRWTRLNTYLVVASVSLAAWAAMFAATSEFPYKSWVLCLLCMPSFVLGVLWGVLGWRSSCYMDDFHDQALDVEKHIPLDLPKPFGASEKRRKEVRSSLQKFTSSKLLVTIVPLIFSLLFLVLTIGSLVIERQPRPVAQTKTVTEQPGGHGR